jgi:ATP-dependent Lhr-like helicase
MRARFDGRQAWCDRRLLARIRRHTLERLRKEIEPVTASQFLRFLACWQHADGEHRLEGPRGVAAVISKLAGFEVPAAAWEASVLPARVRGYKREWLDQITLSGEVMWGRLWGSGATPVRRTPLCLFPREEAESWAALSAAVAGPGPAPELGGTAADVQEALVRRGPMFLQELGKESHLPAASVEEGLASLIAQGRVTCDSFGGLRLLIVPAWRRRSAGVSAGRWSLLGRTAGAVPSAQVVARQMLRRTGVVFRKTLEREKHGVPWRDLARACRLLEARGEIRGGRFVAGFDGEQYALPEAVTLLRSVRRRAEWPAGPPPVTVSAADPLNFRGILTPEEKVSPLTRQQVRVG